MAPAEIEQPGAVALMVPDDDAVAALRRDGAQVARTVARGVEMDALTALRAQCREKVRDTSGPV